MADLGTLTVHLPGTQIHRVPALLINSNEIVELTPKSYHKNFQNYCILGRKGFITSSPYHNQDLRDTSDALDANNNIWTWYHPGAFDVMVKVSTGSNPFRLRVQKSRTGENLKVTVHAVAGVIASQR